MTTPFIGYRSLVPDAWIDINGHMNATHYGLAVYEAHYNFAQEIGLGDKYVNDTNCGKAVLESHMIYEREVAAGAELEIRCWLLAVDTKRMHFFNEVHNLTTGVRAAASEQIDIHIDLAKRRSAPLPEHLYLALQSRVEANLAMPLPDKIGSQLRPPKNHWLQPKQ